MGTSILGDFHRLVLGLLCKVTEAFGHFTAFLLDHRCWTFGGSAQSLFRLRMLSKFRNMRVISDAQYVHNESLQCPPSGWTLPIVHNEWAHLQRSLAWPGVCSVSADGQHSDRAPGELAMRRCLSYAPTNRPGTKPGDTWMLACAMNGRRPGWPSRPRPEAPGVSRLRLARRMRPVGRALCPEARTLARGPSTARPAVGSGHRR